MARIGHVEGLLRSACLLVQSTRGTFAANSTAGITTTVAGSGRYSPAVRQASSKAELFEELVSLPTRKGLFNGVGFVASLLPNREHFAAQFSPHGISLIPRILAEQQAGSKQARKAAGCATKSQPSISPIANVSQVYMMNGQHQEGLLAVDKTAGDRTKRWRRLKIKKHKIKKRRRLNRYKDK